ncbi:hypothetical protein L873DRAFT_1711364 [Choiromyces venosus 120613-1]|uniref:Vacuolar import and degradation protein 21 n=1 Tax=Choiromyces venosus 120613-1 TaxID=1336337 RepID=A0A3N4J1R3_9PEZI|nr:hypothetical protein L873DRAFT_1711364 [Choiromyces venosus 120613-1]
MVEKISIQNLRSNAVSTRLEERKNLIVSRKRKLQEVYAVCRHIDRTKPFPNADIVETWGTIERYEGANMEDGEKRFLEENDIERGRFFRESTLPPHSSYLAEPGGFQKSFATQLTPHPAIKTISQHATPLSTPVLEKPPQMLEHPTVSQEAELLAEKEARHAFDARKRMEDQSPTKSGVTNGKRSSEAPTDDGSVDSEATEDDLGSLSHVIEPSERVKSGNAAPVINVGGVPVVQEATTRVPDDHERSLGVRPPPILSELLNAARGNTTQTAAALDDKSVERNIWAEKAKSTESPAVKSFSDSVREVPDSFESSQVSSLSEPPSPAPSKGAILELREEPRLPVASPQIQQIPPHPPLAIITNRDNHPSPISHSKLPSEHLSHPDISSPTSSIDGDNRSTPGNIISSATSPDANHMLGSDSRPGESNGQIKEVVAESAPYGVMAMPAKQAEKEELAGSFMGRKMAPCGAQCEKPLPSVLVATEVVADEKETQSQLPTIPPQELTNGGEPDLAAVETEAEITVPKAGETPQSTRTKKSASPDPSAQLRLENSLAQDDVVKPDSVANERPYSQKLAGVGEAHDEDLEDQVQLVGSSEPEPKTIQPTRELVEAVTEVVKDVSENMEVDIPDRTGDMDATGHDTVMTGIDQPGVHRTTSGTHVGDISIGAISLPEKQSLEASTLQEIDDSKMEIDHTANERHDEIEPVHKLPTSDLTASVGAITEIVGQPADSTFEHNNKEENLSTGKPIVDATKSSGSLVPDVSPIKQHLRKRETPKRQAKLSKVVISSTHHALAALEEEAKRLREDQIAQGPIVVARRRDQQAASAAARRSAVFQPGSKIDAITRYGIAEPPSEEKSKVKNADMFDVAYTAKASGTSISDLLQRSSKTLTTADHQVHYFETQAVRIENRILDLQDQGLWSLRQIPRVVEPRRRKCHWDYLLEEAKWLRDDFKGERKWKIAMARLYAKEAARWHRAGEGRRQLQVDRKQLGVVPKGIREERRRIGHVEMQDSDMSQPTPDLVDGCGSPESDDDFPMDDRHHDTDRSNFAHIYEPPATLFTLSPEETIFAMPASKAADDILNQLPLYGPPEPPTRRYEDIEEEWMKLPIVAISKYASGKLVVQEEKGPPSKKSRYEYEENQDPYADDSDEDEKLGGGRLIGRSERDKLRKPSILPPEQTNVALFKPEYKPILQRLHNTHVPRLPSDFPPPAFFENRHPSLWLASEDEMLKTLVREYHYNWGLVSQCLALPGGWHSGSERRSPWECFERWIALEPIPPEFAKSPHFKPIQQRLDVAARVNGLYGNVPGSAGGNGSGGVKPRRGTAPIRVEKRRNTRNFTLIESMRKLAKKRETSVNKQQTNKSMISLLTNHIDQVAAAMKRASESQASASNQLRTPQYFSAMKFEREQKHLEQKNMYSQHMQMQQARNGIPPQTRIPHPGQHHGLANGVPIPVPQRVGVPAPQGPNGALQVPRAAPMQNGTNGVTIRSLPAQLPQGQTQRYTPEQLAHLRRIQQQHAVAVAAASQGYPPSSALGTQGSQINAQNMQALLQQAQQAALGQNQQAPQQKRIIPPPIDSQASVSSPHIPPTPTTATSTQLKPAQMLIQEMAAIVQYQNPNLPQERVREATQQTLVSYHAQLSQNIQAQARNPVKPNPARAAVVNTGPMIGVNGPVNSVVDPPAVGVVGAVGAVGAGSPRVNNSQIPTQPSQPQPQPQPQPQASPPPPQPQSVSKQQQQ